MSSKFYIPVCLLTMMLCLFACEKDYPKDIPDWARADIKESKRGQINCGFCDSYNPRSVSEYFDINYGVVFKYTNYYNSSTQIYFTYYDYDQHEICSAPGTSTNICTTLPSFKPEYKRHIYSSK